LHNPSKAGGIIVVLFESGVNRARVPSFFRSVGHFYYRCPKTNSVARKSFESLLAA
jgi:hypothetical protein